MAAASTIAWVWTILTLLIAVAITIPLLAEGRGFPWALAAFFGLGALCGVGAFGIRRGKRPYNFIAVAASLLWIVMLLLQRVTVSPVGIALNLVVIGIVASHWRRFE